MAQVAEREKRNQYNQKTNKPQTPSQQPTQISWKIILEIPPNTEINERSLKLYFRKAARKYHPDVTGGDDTKMKQILLARDIAYKEMGLL